MHRLSDYNYLLPDELIAQEPATERHLSRLLLLDRISGTCRHETFTALPALLKPGDALVINNTRVIPARFEAFRETGGHVEIFLLEKQEERQWKALARPSARLKEGERLRLHRTGEALLESHLGGGEWLVRFDGMPQDSSIEELGRMPLPHYIEREKLEDPRDARDRERYQTIYSAHPGAVAAPTAGLHFTPEILADLETRGVEIVRVTLHVGFGTFAPVREEDYTQHRIHSERFDFSEESAARLNQVRSRGGRIVAVGTTSARVLETVVSEDGRFAPAAGETRIFIYPPYTFKAVDLLLTNFHLPQSTLLLMVSAFASRETILAAYHQAIENRYRFFSYGDAMLIG